MVTPKSAQVEHSTAPLLMPTRGQEAMQVIYPSYSKSVQMSAGGKK